MAEQTGGDWTPAPFVAFVFGVEGGKPWRFRVGGYQTLEEAREGCKRDLAHMSRGGDLMPLIDLRVTGARTYRIFEAVGGYVERPTTEGG